ncbi:MAG: LacI family transcriptional regulator [Alphaproteobacteria bacterium]|nr:LacI family transcriptional regulator [Alphaproteobacteria bacterium]
MDQKHPTIQDVARHANVSTATVSRALSQPGQVSKAARERVTRAVSETGYIVNQAARSLRARTTRTILVALPDISNPFFSTILDSIERTIADRGYATLITNRGRGSKPHERLAGHLRSNRADGIILMDGLADLADVLRLYGPGDTAPVVIACEAIENVNLPTVKTDNQGASAIAVDHLAKLGHRRIGHVTSPAGNVLGRERGRGFRDGLIAHGIEFDPILETEGDFKAESGARAAQYFLGLDHPPSAIFCDNDIMALGLISELRSKGYSVPDDFSVVGFDDIEVAARLSPPLTTMRQARPRIGFLAANALIDIL